MTPYIPPRAAHSRGANSASSLGTGRGRVVSLAPTAMGYTSSASEPAAGAASGAVSTSVPHLQVDCKRLSGVSTGFSYPPSRPGRRPGLLDPTARAAARPAGRGGATAPNPTATP